MLFRHKLKHGLIKPEATKEGPICMDTYRYVPQLFYIHHELIMLLDGCSIVAEYPAMDWIGVYLMRNKMTRTTLATSLSLERIDSGNLI